MMYFMCIDLLHSCAFEFILAVDKYACAVCCFAYFFLHVLLSRSRQVEANQARLGAAVQVGA